MDSINNDIKIVMDKHMRYDKLDFETQNKILIENYIHRVSVKSYICRTCHYKKIMNVERHMKTNFHKTSLIQLQIKNKNAKQEDFDKTKENNSPNLYIFTKAYYCIDCEVYLTSNMILKCHCLLHFYKENKLLKNDIIQFSFDKDDEVLIECFLCNERIRDEKMLAQHLEDKFHYKRLCLIYNETDIKKNEHENLIDENNIDSDINILNVIFCKMCNKKILETSTCQHIEKHHNNDTSLSLEIENNDIFQINLVNLYTCFLCNVSYHNKFLLLQHFQEKTHIYNIKHFYTQINNTFISIMKSKVKFICRICCTILPNRRVYQLHIVGLNHKKLSTLRNKQNKQKDILIKSINFDYSSKPTTSNSDNLDSLNFSKTKKNILPSIKNKNSNQSNLIEHKNQNINFDYSSKFTISDLDDILNNLDSLNFGETERNILPSIKNKNSNQSSFDKDLKKLASSYIKMCIEPGEINIYTNLNMRHKEHRMPENTNFYSEFLNVCKNAWYYAQVFYCEICKARRQFELSFIKHLKSKEHDRKLKKCKLIHMKFDLCPICITCWYGTFDAYDRHCESIYHKQFLINKELMVPDMPVLVVELLNDIDNSIKHLINESNKTIDLEKERELNLLKAVEETVKSIYPQAKAYIFGSRLSHLGFSNSDVDVYLDCENMYYNTVSKKQSNEYLQSVQHLFDNQQDHWVIEEVLLRTRVPILKLRHIDTQFKCDISFLNGLGVEKSKLIKYFNIAFPICRELILYLKKWLTYCKLSGSDVISSYAISWYVIFYLQTKKILPSVYLLLKLKNQSTIVDGWECGSIETIPVNATNLKFKDLLKEFFLYYATFDYYSNVACPFLGIVVKKSSFANVNKLPDELEIYKQRFNKEEVDFFRIDSPMCIQDPVALSQNITKAVTKLNLRCFMKYCDISKQIISNDY